VSRTAIVADVLRSQARQLKMPGLTRSFEDLARQAREEHWSYEDYLHEVLAVEIASRGESAVKQRLHAAAFPEMKTLDQFDFGAAEGVSAPRIAELARCDWIARGENVLLAGPIGTGKTHLAISLGVEAARQRRRVAFSRAADLVRALIEAATPRSSGAPCVVSSASTCSSSTKSASCPSIARAVSCSSTCSQLGTDDAACSSPPTSPSPSGHAFSAAMRSSPRPFSIALPSTPR
jgi:IstB-like ATP binding protein